MSAIEQGESRALGPDNIRRYHTTCKVRIDGHNLSEPLYISDDVQTIQMSKSIKGPGQANITFVATKNYLNLINPNDYINIYFNTKDGSGWTRTFFGFIDRIEEFYEVSSDGKPVTKYQLACSDFYKAIERTMIYFNPHLQGRSDLDGSFVATPNIGGLALMTRGIRVTGSPADVTQNNILLTLGFGSQFLLPSSYPRTLVNELRQERAKYAKGRLGADIRRAISNAGTYEAFRAQLLQDSKGLASDVAGRYSDPEERLKHLAEEENLNIDNIDAATASNEDALSRVIFDARLREQLIADGGGSGDFDGGVLNLLESTVSTAPATLLDVLDVFTFVERESIDGYNAEIAVWQKQGSVMSIIKSLSNEGINELIFDLRPVTTEEVGFDEGAYSRSEDDLGENLSDGTEPSGIRYVPAMVMREYPFSTIDGLDLTGVSTGLHGRDPEEEDIGVLYFGPIFSDRPNDPGRHVVTGPAIRWDSRVGGVSAELGKKHLDVAVVHEQEIIRSQLGRSDREHFNLFEFYSQDILGEDQRYYMNDLLPIITPVHVLRHGLRVRSIHTRFARFNTAVAARGRTHVTPEEAETAETATEEAEPESTTSADLPVVATGDITTPVNAADGPRYRSPAGLDWGYRPRSSKGGWVFHHGIDIPAGTLFGTPEAKQIPIYAIADGDVVLSAPIGCYSLYGNIVVIKHKFSGYDGYIYSAYNHLTHRTVGVDIDKETGLSTVRSGTTRDRPTYAAPGCPGVAVTHMAPIRVRKGDIIGYMGNTGTVAQGTNGNVHLHFEIVRTHPPGDSGRVNKAAPVIPFSERPSSSSPPPPPSNIGTRSIDPEVFFQSHGLDLVALLRGGPPTDPEEDEAEEGDDLGGNVPDITPREDLLEPEEEETQAETQGIVVDSALSREQIIRWGLLQDHWYQHNLEYLSGRIDMRGAPEIRVGYRLDWEDRDMSFYVEGVNHAWNFPDKMVTSLQVTRGQPNNPYPLYVTPPIEAFTPTGTQRAGGSSRLAKYFVTPDPRAIRRALVLRQVQGSLRVGPDNQVNNIAGSEQYQGLLSDSSRGNLTDRVTITSENIAPTYNEKVVADSDRSVTQLLNRDRNLVEAAEAVGATLSGLSRTTGTDPTAPVDPENP